MYKYFNYMTHFHLAELSIFAVYMQYYEFKINEYYLIN